MKKIKGKLNFLDIFIVLLLIVVLTFGISKFKKTNKKADSPQSGKLLVTYFAEEIPDYVAESIQKDMPVTEKVQSANFGKVKDVRVDKAVSWDKKTDGEIVKVSKDGFNSVSISMEIDGSLTENGISIDKSNYHVGQTISLFIGNSYIETGRISDVKSLEM